MKLASLAGMGAGGMGPGEGAALRAGYCENLAATDLFVELLLGFVLELLIGAFELLMGGAA